MYRDIQSVRQSVTQSENQFARESNRTEKVQKESDQRQTDQSGTDQIRIVNFWYDRPKIKELCMEKMNLKLSALSWSIYSVFSLIFTVWRFNIIDIVINRHRRHWILFTELYFRKLKRFLQKWNSYRRKKKSRWSLISFWFFYFSSFVLSPLSLSILNLYLPIFSSPLSRHSSHEQFHLIDLKLLEILRVALSDCLIV